ncbi:hypothetical protein [Paenibacillus ihuae]|uniref:hypothetical protein n=1 Tax=Paenibacillus ihuae TaxID=1232431 RepID=UPI0006D57A3B|nr:hypothetical protein [Paenibacillus ihuae]
MRVTVTEIEIGDTSEAWTTLARVAGKAGSKQKQIMPYEQPKLNFLPVPKPFFIAGYEKAYEKGMCYSTQDVNPRGQVLDQRG